MDYTVSLSFQNPDEKAKEQLEQNRINLEEWFGRDIGYGWNYLSSIFCIGIHPSITSHCQSCSTCDDFIIHGKDELSEKLARIEARLPKRTQISKVDLEEFKILIKYLLFSMPNKALPIGGNFSKVERLNRE